MAINKNHEFEDLEGIKCAVVERNVKAGRVTFLRELLELNGYSVIVVPSPPPKNVDPASEPAPDTGNTVGVTDVTFNATNAIFGRLLKTKKGTVVTRAYWLQEEAESDDTVPYYDRKKVS
ncbi:MAG: hypothetical protein IM547_06515 [Chitinophagaceae bacterium]|nr:hypothetical protein [Chitinophagaceae bacterium]